MALYETDEDLVDEAISRRMATGDFGWSEIRHPRLTWSDLDPMTLAAYRRRGRAALAALAYVTHDVR